MEPSTPLRNKSQNDVIAVPASPFMKKIGFGSRVAVYELQRTTLLNKTCSPWAVKKVLRDRANKQVEKRLRTEAEILRRLSHPNIVGFRGYVKGSDGRSTILMEECHKCLGDMLEQRFENDEGPYSAKIILKVAYDVAKALDYLHNTALLLHGDVKSFNVLINGDFNLCKLCDFGVSMPVTKSGELDKSKVKLSDQYYGTYCWCAPEVLHQPQTITTMADIYAFGLILWEMIACCPPIYDDSTEFDSNQSFNDSDIENQKLRLRPAMPDVKLGPEYNFVLEVYYCCTTIEKEKRPTASDLTILLLDMLNTM